MDAVFYASNLPDLVRQMCVARPVGSRTLVFGHRGASETTALRWSACTLRTARCSRSSLTEP